jgi:Ku70/Ku80 beta-barrel domain
MRGYAPEPLDIQFPVVTGALDRDIPADQDELASVAPGRSRLLEIHAFVDLDDIDPLYFNKAYFLGPRGEETETTRRSSPPTRLRPQPT